MYFVGRVSAKRVTRRRYSWRDVGLRLRLTRPANLTQHAPLSALNWRTTLPCVTSVIKTSGQLRNLGSTATKPRSSPAADFTGILQRELIKISMNGRHRAFGNSFVERLWRNFRFPDPGGILNGTECVLALRLPAADAGESGKMPLLVRP